MPSPSRRSAALVAAVALVLPVVGVVLAPVASAAPTTPARGSPHDHHLTASPSSAVEAGKKLRLKVRVAPAVAGTVTFLDGTRTVDTARVKDGRVKVVVVRTGVRTCTPPASRRRRPLCTLPRPPPRSR